MRVLSVRFYRSWLRSPNLLVSFLAQYVFAGIFLGNLQSTSTTRFFSQRCELFPCSSQIVISAHCIVYPRWCKQAALDFLLVLRTMYFTSKLCLHPGMPVRHKCGKGEMHFSATGQNRHSLHQNGNHDDCKLWSPHNWRHLQSCRPFCLTTDHKEP